MFEKGDYILYETIGVCQVREISRLEFLKNDRIYYSITPVFEKDTVIYVPVDNDKVKMRPIMTKEEAEDFVDSMPGIESYRPLNDKERPQVYKEVLMSGDRREWASMMKSVFEMRQARKLKGGKLAIRDEESMKKAEKLLYGELAAALDLQPHQVPEYIENRLSTALHE